MSRLVTLCALALIIVLPTALPAQPDDLGPVFVRFRVLSPERRFVARLGGWGASWLHVPPWAVPSVFVPADRASWGDVANWVQPNEWTPWVDLSDRDWHGRLNREGGVAEWPALGIQLRGNEDTLAVQADADDFQAENANYQGPVSVEVQLATGPAEDAVVAGFIENGSAGEVAFLLPMPLEQHIDELETGSQMAARHRAWAEEATGGRPVSLKQCLVATSIWGHYDPDLCRQEVETLKLLGFNTINDGRWPLVMRDADVSPFWQTEFEPDPELQEWHWHQLVTPLKERMEADPEGTWHIRNARWVTLSDEIKVLDLRDMVPSRLNGEFRAFLTRHGVEPAELGAETIGQVRFPLDAVFEATLPPREAVIEERRLFTWAARFGQWWTVKQLRQKSDLIRRDLGSPTHTLPTDHGFLNAWGPPYMGMSARLLDLFELGRQEAVSYLGTEDWLGLNHMYGPGSTWTGAQTFEYFTAVLRSGISDPRKQQLVAWITPSDEDFLRLKVFAMLAQGVKHFYFWTYGPTHISTENYWSDLRSEYDGIAKALGDIEQVEDALYPAQVVHDPVAILYSVSHDIQHPDDPACFVEKRLLWHALRHLGVQPRFVDEGAVVAGGLQGYRVLCVVDRCVSREAASAIDDWVERGGVLYASAGAASEDEYGEPQLTLHGSMGILPPEQGEFTMERHAYNERTDLPGLAAMAQATIALPDGEPEMRLPVLGYKHDIRPDQAEVVAHFDDGWPAAVIRDHELGRVMYVGFLPMLAYGQLAGFQPTTLAEKWPSEPRRFLEWALREAGVQPTVTTNVPVVGATLLAGEAASVVVLANFTYEPVEELIVRVSTANAFSSARSVEHGELAVHRVDGGVELRLPLEWTDLIVLQ